MLRILASLVTSSPSSGNVCLPLQLRLLDADPGIQEDALW
jgi:hypothetical protein